MANCMFAYPDRTLTASIATAGSAWTSAFPLNNLKNKTKTKVARSSGVTANDTKFDIDLGSVQSIKMLAILNHNASFMQATTSGVTIKFSATAPGNSELGTHSGAFWGTYYPDDVPYAWGDLDFWGGTLSDAEAADYRPSPDFWITFPEVAPRYIRVEITDLDNPAGYFQLGRCFVARALQPEINMDYGASIIWKQDVIKDRSVGGTDWFEVTSQGREISGQLPNLSIAEGMVHVFDRQRRLGQEGELYFIFDPDDTLLLYKQRAMLCRFGTEDPLTFPYNDASSTSFNLVEVR